jgi:hypothetical protein
MGTKEPLIKQTRSEEINIGIVIRGDKAPQQRRRINTQGIFLARLPKDRARAQKRQRHNKTNSFHTFTLSFRFTGKAA